MHAPQPLGEDRVRELKEGRKISPLPRPVEAPIELPTPGSEHGSAPTHLNLVGESEPKKKTARRAKGGAR